MKSFLEQVAADLYGRYGDGISSLHVLFPSRRASLFFGEALAGIIPRPIWQPASITIDSLMEEISGLRTGDRLRLVTELYKIYSAHHPAESFDGFYFWGELLLGDFDSIDKYLIDADALFSNLVDLRELDSRFDMEPEQLEAITKFWRSFGSSGTFSPEQRDFLTVWRTLAPVYHEFRARLREVGIAYRGMVYREAAERTLSGKAPEIPERHYVIAGFNALSKCEQVLFGYLKKSCKADFYWDYDNYFVQDPAQEAGMFMRDKMRGGEIISPGNLRQFPPAVGVDGAPALSGGHDNFIKPKHIRSVAAASDVLQCKYAGLALARLALQNNAPPGKETAVVLADESLLTPLLWSMPPEITHINITMGYPLRMHPAYTFVERLVELQNRRRDNRGSSAFYHSDVDGLLRHPYINAPAAAGSQYIYVNAARLHTTPLLEKIFAAPGDGNIRGDWRAMSGYLTDVIAEVARLLPDTGNDSDGTGRHADFLAVIAEHIRTLAESLDGCDIELSPKTYASLMRRSLQSITVPFEGEPLEGVQVMGILETRALDFENIIFLSCGEDTMPGNLTGAPSFIPYNLKKAYGLPTPEHHEGVYAYHFFRLIQRARNIEMVWPSTADERGAGGPSRYILQLDYEDEHHHVEKDAVTVDVNLSPTDPVVVEKNPEIMRRLGEFLMERPEGGSTGTAGGAPGPLRKLSPSLYSAYVECPLKFYFRGVAGLCADSELSEEVDGALFGNILHLAMHKLYTPLVGVRNPQRQIRALINSARVDNAATGAAAELDTKQERSAPENWSGGMILAHKTIVDYINRNILPFDASREGFTIEKLEEWIGMDATFGSGAAPQTVRFYGKADRVDRLPDGALRIVDYKTGSPKAKNSAELQMRLYAMMLRTQHGQQVRPELYYVRHLPDVVQLADSGAEFEERLHAGLAELFDPAVPFTRCPDPKPCEWCGFNTICRR